MRPFHISILAAFLLALSSFFLFSGFKFWVALGAIFILLNIILYFGVTRLAWNFFGLAFCHQRAMGKKVALTFDDGPDAACTGQLLEFLGEQKCRAAFFVTGERAAKYPQILEQMVAAGHIVGNHTMHHLWWTNLMSERRLTAEISAANAAIYAACGKKCRFFRPPVGLANNILFRVLKKLDLFCIGFSNGRYDRAEKDGAHLAGRIMANLKNGDIIILHDSERDTKVLLTALKQLFTELTAAGYQIVPLDELIGRPAYFES